MYVDLCTKSMTKTVKPIKGKDQKRKQALQQKSMFQQTQIEEDKGTSSTTKIRTKDSPSLQIEKTAHFVES